MFNFNKWTICYCNLRPSLLNEDNLVLYWGTSRRLSSVGRASALQAEGQRFEPVSLHHEYASVV